MVDPAAKASCHAYGESSGEAPCKIHKSTDPIDRPAVRQAVCDVVRRRQRWSPALPYSICFRPWFVDKAFQKWHASYNYAAIDYISLRIDLVIWLLCAATAPLMSLPQLLAALGRVLALLALVGHWLYPESYMQHRTAITSARRLLTLPYIRWSAVKTLNPSGPVAAVMLHLLVQTGSLHTFVGSLFFLLGWRVAALNSLAGLAVISGAVGPSCSQLLAGPHADSAAWRRLAAALDRAAGGAFRHSLQQPALAGAVCRTTATSMQVLLTCASVCATFLIERGFRLRFKQQQLPASVAAMQGHIYVLPWWLEVPQVLLVLWVPAVLTWLAAGAWYGLAAAA